MTKKELIRLAEYIIDSHKDRGEYAEHYVEPFTAKQIDQLANFCQEQNPAFKRDRWLAFIKGECGPNGGAK